MADRLSPLASIAPAENGAGAILTQVGFGVFVQVVAWPETVDTVRSVLRDIVGLDVPEAGRAVQESTKRILALAPGRYLVASGDPDLVIRLESALPSAEAAVTDVSHGRVVLRIAGNAPELLSKVVAVDLHGSAFPVGQIAQTTIDHVDVILHRVGPGEVEVWCFRSFAEALTEWLLDAGPELGIAFSR